MLYSQRHIAKAISFGDTVVKDTLGSATLSSVERLSFSWRLKCTNAMGKGPKRASFVGRLSFSWRGSFIEYSTVYMS